MLHIIIVKLIIVASLFQSGKSTYFFDSVEKQEQKLLYQLPLKPEEHINFSECKVIANGIFVALNCHDVYNKYTGYKKAPVLRIFKVPYLLET